MIPSNRRSAFGHPEENGKVPNRRVYGGTSNLRRCPHCQRRFEPLVPAWLPFCSERCQLIDLGRWLGEEYRVPGKPQDLPEEWLPEDE